LGEENEYWKGGPPAKNILGSSGLGVASELADGCVMVFASVCPASLAIVNVLIDDELRSYNGGVRTLLVG
jgi:hypothetical protein